MSTSSSTSAQISLQELPVSHGFVRSLQRSGYEAFRVDGGYLLRKGKHSYLYDRSFRIKDVLFSSPPQFGTIAFSPEPVALPAVQIPIEVALAPEESPTQAARADFEQEIEADQEIETEEAEASSPSFWTVFTQGELLCI